MDSLKKRYFYKLGAGFFSTASLGAIQALVLRALGPMGYGDFNFLNTFFIQVITFLDMGTADGFYTKLSKRPKETGLVAFYYIFIVSSCIGILVLTFLACASPYAGLIWPGQQARYVVMGAVLGILTWMHLVLNKSSDAYGLTVPAEAGRVIQKVIGIVLLALLVWFHRLTLTSFFIFWYLLMAFLGMYFIWVNRRHGYPLPSSFRLRPDQFKSYASEFYSYGHPLAVHGAVAFITAILGRWLLQHFSGSVQQAYFGLSYQIANACFLGVRLMAPLLMREFSLLHQKRDIPEMAALFRKHIPLLFSVTAYFACFIALQSDTVIRILGGSAYAEAGTAVMLMSLSSIHQTYGLLSGSVFLATGRTKLYRNVGIFTMLAGLALNYFLLAPASAGGLHLGATGFALQTLVTQFVGVNVQLYLNAKYLRLPFLRYVGHQVASFSVLLALAYAARTFADALVGQGPLWIAGFVLAGVFYTVAAGALAWTWPRLFGLTSGQLASLLDGFRAKRACA